MKRPTRLDRGTIWGVLVPCVCRETTLPAPRYTLAQINLGMKRAERRGAMEPPGVKP